MDKAQAYRVRMYDPKHNDGRTWDVSDQGAYVRLGGRYARSDVVVAHGRVLLANPLAVSLGLVQAGGDCSGTMRLLRTTTGGHYWVIDLDTLAWVEEREHRYTPRGSREQAVTARNLEIVDWLLGLLA